MSSRYEALNKKALIDADLYAKTGRVRTPSPAVESDEDLEIIDIEDDSFGGVAKSRKSVSAGICRCEATSAGTAIAQSSQKTEELVRDAHIVVCVEDSGEEDVRSLEDLVKAEPESSSSEEAVEGTASDFVPSDAEQESETNCTCTESEDVTCEDTDNNTEEDTDDCEEVEEQVHYAHLLSVINIVQKLGIGWLRMHIGIS